MDNKRFNKHNYKVSDYNNISRRPQRNSPRFGGRGMNDRSSFDRQQNHAGSSSNYSDHNFNDYFLNSDSSDKNYDRSYQTENDWRPTQSRDSSSNYQDRNTSGFGQTGQGRRNWDSGADREDYRTSRSFNQGRLDSNNDIPTYSSRYGSGTQSYNPTSDWTSSDEQSTLRNWGPSQDYHVLDRDYHQSTASQLHDQHQKNRNDYRQSDFLGTNKYGSSYGRDHNDHDEGLLESMKSAVKGFFGKGPKGYQRSDERIREDVSEVLFRHPHIDASEIEIMVKGGTVTMAGTVPNRQMKRLAEDAVEDCSGVMNVSNQIMVASNLASQTHGTSGLNQTQAATQTTGKGKNVQ